MGRDWRDMGKDMTVIPGVSNTIEIYAVVSCIIPMKSTRITQKL